jgi:hypothetical protein
MVRDFGTDPCPLTPTPLENSIFSGLSVNDILMIGALVDPLVYTQPFDLSSFSTLDFLPT